MKKRGRRKKNKGIKKAPDEVLLCEVPEATMPVVDQSEPVQAGVATLTNTLEIFDKFKSNEEKESDEESFHLPMLDEDESESKSTHSYGNKESHNGETEDDILNKFDTVGNSATPDFDAKNEDSILDDAEDMVDNQMKSDITTILDNLDDNADSPSDNNSSHVTALMVNIEYKEMGSYEENIEVGEFMSKYELESIDSQCNSVVSEAMEVQTKNTTEEAEFDNTQLGENEECNDENPEDEEIEEPSEQDNVEGNQEENPVEDDQSDDQASDPEADIVEYQSNEEPCDENDEEPVVNKKVNDTFEDMLHEEHCDDSNEKPTENSDEINDTVEDQPNEECDEENDEQLIENPEEINDVEESQPNEESCEENDEQPIENNEPTDTVDEIEDGVSSPSRNEDGVDASNENEDGDDVCNENEDVEMICDNEAADEAIEEHNTEDVAKEGTDVVMNDIEDEDVEMPLEEENNDESPEENKQDENCESSDQKSLHNEDQEGNVSADEVMEIAEDDKKEDPAPETAEQSENLGEDAEYVEVDEGNENKEENENNESEEAVTNHDIVKEQDVDDSKQHSSDDDEPLLIVEEEPEKTPANDDGTSKSKINLEDDPLLRELEETIKTPEPLPEAKEQSKPNDNLMKATSKEHKEEVPKDPPPDSLTEPSQSNSEASAEKPTIDANIAEDETDLLDISIVRDTEEDDACAIQTAIEDTNAMFENDANETDNLDDTTDVPTSDKSDDDQVEQLEAIDGEAEESTDDKDEGGIDLDELSSDCGPVESIQSSDSEHKEDDSDKAASEKLKTNKGNEVANSKSAVDKVKLGVNSEKEKTDVSGKEDSAVIEDVQVEEIESTEKDSAVEPANQQNEDVVMLDDESDEKAEEEVLRPKSAKRSLPPSEEEVGAKKIRLSVPDSVSEPEPAPPKPDVLVLSSFYKYMQTKKISHRITRSDLEQFCLQKLCEVMWHKTAEGELHQTIAKQSQTIEQLRKDLQQLTKQAKDLETVNKKLMNELRGQGQNKKPLVPLKITRSVGLQVRLGNPSENLAKRRLAQQQQQQAPAPPPPVVLPSQTTPVGRPAAKSTAGRSRAVTTTTTGLPQAPLPSVVTVVRQQQQQPSPQKNPPPLVPTPTPLLSQALTGPGPRRLAPAGTPQKRVGAAARAANTPTPPRPPAGGSGAGVIDLTDEDDRSRPRPANRGVPAKGASPKILGTKGTPTGSAGTRTVNSSGRTVTALSQNVRLATNQVKNGSIAIPSISSSGGTQLMYVPLSTITSTAGPNGQKTVFLNLQPTNGVLANAQMSVVQAKTGGVTLKQASRKHPAPLPCPPRILPDQSLKPVPPKPHLSIRKTDKGIILQWKMPYNLDMFESIYSYQLYAYQETSQPPSTDMWRKVGDVKALALPMACTLTQFADKNKYYFAVRSVDVHKRIGAFSDPEEISL